MKKIDVSFYEIYGENFEKIVCQLIDKCYQASYKCFVYTKNEQEQESINKLLWTFSQKSFIAHGSLNDPLPEQQPVLLSTNMDILNGAEILLSIGIDFKNLSNFSRALFVFNGNIESEKNLCSELYNKYKSIYQTNFYIQNQNGSWSSRDIVN